MARKYTTSRLFTDGKPSHKKEKHRESMRLSFQSALLLSHSLTIYLLCGPLLEQYIPCVCVYLFQNNISPVCVCTSFRTIYLLCYILQNNISHLEECASFRTIYLLFQNNISPVCVCVYLFQNNIYPVCVWTSFRTIYLFQNNISPVCAALLENSVLNDADR